MIKHDEMVKVLAKPGQDIIDDLTPGAMHNLHMAIGICGEVGELLEALRDGEDNILEELGDIEFYFEGLQQGVNYKVDDNHVNILFHNRGLKPLMEELSIQSGDILDTIKKQAIYAKELDFNKISELILDFRAILTAVYNHSEIACNPYMAKCENINKLGKRYEGFKYTNEAAQNRADKVS